MSFDKSFDKSLDKSFDPNSDMNPEDNGRRNLLKGAIGGGVLAAGAATLFGPAPSPRAPGGTRGPGWRRPRS